MKRYKKILIIVFGVLFWLITIFSFIYELMYEFDVEKNLGYSSFGDQVKIAFKREDEKAIFQIKNESSNGEKIIMNIISEDIVKIRDLYDEISTPDECVFIILTYSSEAEVEKIEHTIIYSVLLE